MKAAKLSAADIFQGERFQVPVFQRAYVWTTDHWAGFWIAIRERAMARLEGRTARPLFLGSIVLDTYPATPSTAIRREIVDGQHRLTTLQLALAAGRDISWEFGGTECTPLFEELIHDVTGLRLRSNCADRELFSAVMNAGSREEVVRTQPKDRPHPSVTSGYLYFSAEFRSWLLAMAPKSLVEAMRALLAALKHDVQFFVLDLQRNLLWRVLYGLFANRFWPVRSRAAAMGNGRIEAVSKSRASRTLLALTQRMFST